VLYPALVTKHGEGRAGPAASSRGAAIVTGRGSDSGAQSSGGTASTSTHEPPDHPHLVPDAGGIDIRVVDHVIVAGDRFTALPARRVACLRDQLVRKTMDYTEHQNEAIHHLDGNLQVIACAGSAKPSACSACVNIFETELMLYWSGHIVAFTFTIGGW